MNWTITKKDSDVIVKIAARACGILEDLPKIDCIMSLTAVHANGVPMDLDRMLAADNGNLLHDVTGCIAYVDRSTGKLDGNFLPRFAS